MMSDDEVVWILEAGNDGMAERSAKPEETKRNIAGTITFQGLRPEVEVHHIREGADTYLDDYGLS